MKLRDLTTKLISKWKQRLYQDGRRVATVGVYCRHLQSALNWAAEMKFIAEVPTVNPPKHEGMKGRVIVQEEHDRMLLAVEKVVKPSEVLLWQRFLNGVGGPAYGWARLWRCRGNPRAMFR